MDQIAPDMSMRSLQERAARFGGTNTVRNVFIVAIAYYLGAEIAFLIGTLSDRIFAPFWPPNIVLFCALLVTPPRQWWIYIAAALPAHTLAELGVGMPMPQLIVAFVTNCLVAIANAFAVQRLMVEPPWFGTIRKTIIYVLITAFLSPAFCALGGAFVQILGGGSIDDYGLFWARWYASNALGSLTLGPIAMICIESTTRPRLAPAGRAVEAAIVAALLIAACIVAFEDLPSIATGYLPLLLYLPLPIIIWAAVRFGAKGASGAIFVISVALIWRTLNGPSLFDIGSPEANVFGMQLFLIGLSPPILLLGSAIEETRRAERTTRESEERISFAAASSNVGLWQYEFATGAFWATDYCRTLFGLSPSEPLTLRQTGEPDSPERLADSERGAGISNFTRHTAGRRISRAGRRRGPVDLGAGAAGRRRRRQADGDVGRIWRRDVPQVGRSRSRCAAAGNRTSDAGVDAGRAVRRTGARADAAIDGNSVQRAGRKAAARERQQIPVRNRQHI